MNRVFRKIVALFSFCFFFLACPVFSQHVQWGTLQASESALYTPHIMGDDKDFIYTAGKNRRDFFIEKFRKSDMVRQYSNHTEHPKIGEERLETEGIYFVDKKFILFASNYYNAGTEISLYAFIYNAETGKLSGEPRKILTVPVDKIKGQFNIKISENRTKILIDHFAFYRGEKCWKEKYLLLNDDLEPITEREDKIYTAELDFIKFNLVIDNDGSVYYIKKTIYGDTFIVSYDAAKDFEKWEEHIDFSDIDRETSIVKIRFTLNSENDLLLVGYYTLDNKTLEGTFVMKIKTSSKEIDFKKINKFDEETLKRLVSSMSTKRYSRNSPKIPINYYNKIEIVARNDGGFLLFGESFMDAGTTYLWDVIVLSHSADGALMWSQKIPKKQVYSSLSWFKSKKMAGKPFEYMSCFPVIHNDNLKVYLNDRSSYAPLSREQMLEVGYLKTCKIKKMTKSLPVCYSMDLKSGELTKSEMKGKPDEKTFFKPMLSYQDKFNSDAIFFGQYKKNYVFGILKD